MIALLALLLAVAPGVASLPSAGVGPGAPDRPSVAVDLSGRWHLNTDLSDRPPQPGESRDPAEGGGGRPSGGRPPGGGGGGHPGGMGGGMGGGGGMPGGGGRRSGGGGPNPEEMARMRDAMRALLDAPAEMIITRKEDEVVFTVTATGDVTRILVLGKKMKTTAGGAEHEVKADYKDGALVVESTFGSMKVVDTWRLSDDKRQLERLTELDGGPTPTRRPLRRIYDRVQ